MTESSLLKGNVENKTSGSESAPKNVSSITLDTVSPRYLLSKHQWPHFSKEGPIFVFSHPYDYMITIQLALVICCLNINSFVFQMCGKYLFFCFFHPHDYMIIIQLVTLVICCFNITGLVFLCNVWKVPIFLFFSSS